MASEPPRFRVIGRSTPKVDAVAKVTGRAQFGADVRLPRMLTAKVLHSPHAHALIRSIDTGKARALHGVAAVITGRDLANITPGVEGPRGTVSPEHYYMSKEVMARDKVLFQGHPVAAVAAVSADVAEEALELVQVEYDVLDHVLDPVEAMKPGAPLLHDDLDTQGPDGGPPLSRNVAEHLVFGRGDVERGFAEADVVVERSFTTQVVHQGYIEPDAEAAQVDTDGSVEVWANTQAPYAVRNALSVLLDTPSSKIKVTPTEVGGAFGGKETVRVSALCAALSREAGLPVRMALTREEVLRATGPGTATASRVKVGVRRDGIITAIEANIVYDAGAFPGAPLRSALRRVFSHYHTPNLKIDAYDVVTNKPHVAAYRAPGATPTAFALESVVDEAGERLGLEPLEFRLQNVSRAGDPMPDGVLLPSVNLADVLEQVKRHPCWTTPLSGPNQGRGIALGMWTMPGGTTSCHVTVSGDGSVTLVLGTVDLSATRTSLAMVAAEALNIDYDDIRVVIADTDTGSYCDGSSGDRVTYLTSKAVHEATRDLLDKLKGLVAKELGVPQQEIVFDGKGFRVEAAPEKQITLAEAARRSLRSGGALVGYGSVSESPDRVAIAPNAAAHVADVEVDPETGKVDVIGYTTFQDVGRSINPPQVEGQMQGGATQGIGWALSEEYDFDEAGGLRNASLLDYRIPTMLDVPRIGANVVEIPSDDHPYGIRAVGQVPIVPPAGAIANAIYSAVGVRMRELPMKPESVFWALKAARDR